MLTSVKLGYGKEEKLLIVNADDFGLTRSVNDGIVELLKQQAVSSASIMMNCPWSPDAVKKAANLPDADIGIHWTLTSEWPLYRWGPLYRNGSTGSLTDKDGWFPAGIADVERLADPQELRNELIAQLEAARKAGISVTHADSHMGSLYGLVTGRDFLLVAFDICAEYGLPFRLPRKMLPLVGSFITQDLLERAKTRARQAEERGVVLPDYIIGPVYHLRPGQTYDDIKAEGIFLLRSLMPGVTEWISHPAQASGDMKAFHLQWEKRVMEMAFWTDPDVQQVMRQEKIRMIGWKELQQLQQSA
jgi:hypothetical protein